MSRGGILGICSAGHGCSRFARCYDHHRREAASVAPSSIRRDDQGEGLGVNRLVGAPCRAAEGRSQRVAHYDGRPRFRGTEHLRRRYSHARNGSHRCAGPAVYQFPFYLAVLTDASGPYHRPQSSFGRLSSWFGKDHNTPSFQSSQARPFNQWPNGMGFEYFYGFVGGDASQWQPNLFRNTTAIYPFQGNPS